MFNLLIMLAVGMSLAVGLVVFLKPEAVIEFQRRFYEKINWRVEPISMPKEIRNTKIMGLFLVVIALAVVVYIFKESVIKWK
ncbi:MAG: hypothetical protein V1753_06265 [Pseudomonadota bacterium]